MKRPAVYHPDNPPQRVTGRPSKQPKRRRSFHGGASKVLECQDREVCICGPAGTGKTLAVLFKAFVLCERWPGCRVLLVRKTRASLSESVLVTLERHIFPPGHPAVGGPTRHHRNSYVFANGSEIVVGGLDNPSRILSSDYDLVILHEAVECDENDYEVVLTRLRNNVCPVQQAVCDTNPSVPSHWLKTRCDRGGCTMIQSHHRDNPMLFDRDRGKWSPAGEEYLATLGQLTGIRKDRLLDGKWIGQEGLVYDDWNAGVHVVDRFDVPQDWPRYRAIDFGFTNPFTCLWVAVDPDGRMYIYRYLYRTQTLNSDHAKTITALSRFEDYVVTVADHDADGRAQLAADGIPTAAARKDVATGIEAVKARLRVSGDGRPRLFLLKDSLVGVDRLLVAARLPSTIEEEFESYSWSKQHGSTSAKEAPVKRYDHALDALRYLVMHLDEWGMCNSSWFAHGRNAKSSGHRPGVCDRLNGGPLTADWPEPKNLGRSDSMRYYG